MKFIITNDEIYNCNFNVAFFDGGAIHFNYTKSSFYFDCSSEIYNKIIQFLKFDLHVLDLRTESLDNPIIELNNIIDEQKNKISLLTDKNTELENTLKEYAKMGLSITTGKTGMLSKDESGKLSINVIND